jgi:hypothetical protein
MESGSADDLAILRTLRESLSARADGGETGARRALRAVEELIAERQGAVADVDEPAGAPAGQKRPGRLG